MTNKRQQDFSIKTQVRPLVTKDLSKLIKSHHTIKMIYETNKQHAAFTVKVSEPGDSGFLFLTKQSLFCMWTANGQEQRKNGLKKMLIEVNTDTNVVIDETQTFPRPDGCG